MVIVLKPNPDKTHLEQLITWLNTKNVEVHITNGESRSILGLVGDTSSIDIDIISALNIVESVKRVQEPYKKANRKFHPEDTIISAGNVQIGGGSLTIIAGPCSVESEEQILEVARSVKDSGASMLRGGAFKPRTSPYSFQGKGVEGLRLLSLAKKETGLPIVTELMEIHQLEYFGDVDIIQVGARNMQNFNLLKELGSQNKPVLLKRGMSATIEELLMSAEYIMSEGNENVILCERGIRTFETSTRNTLDLSAVPVLKNLTHLPVIVDPSHATGKALLVPSMSVAAAASGADGLIIEVHNDPQHALCDGSQSIRPEEFDALAKRLFAVHNTIRDLDAKLSEDLKWTA